MITTLKHSLKTLVISSALLLISSGCTQKLPKMSFPVQQDTGLLPTTQLLDISQDAKVLQADGYLYVIGRGAGFGIYELNSMTFYSGTSTLQTAYGGYNYLGLDPRSVTAMVKAGGVLIISSGTGLTFIDVSTNVSIPRVVGRLPQMDGQAVGPEVLWQSAVYDPSSNQVYGFRGNQMFTLNMATRSIVATRTISDLSCGRGATRFNNRIFVAGCSVLYELKADGSMTTITGINPIDIVSTSRFLYIHHRPAVGGGSAGSFLEGIYIYDGNFGSQLSIPRRPGSVEPRSFAVSPDDQRLYSSDVDATGRGVELNEYFIPWTNRH